MPERLQRLAGYAIMKILSSCVTGMERLSASREKEGGSHLRTDFGGCGESTL